jgi:thiol:disulfide interchange protein DsbC
MKFSFSKLALIVATIALSLGSVMAQEAAIRKNLSERLPNLPKIDEVSKTPMNGLFEIRMGNEVMYSDAEGNFLIQGALIDVKQKRNLTEERMDKLSAIPFDQLPLKTAFTQVRGNGKRKLAVFADPNCGYCKKLEQELTKVDNVTIYTFLYPVLGEDSKTLAIATWCAADRSKAWSDWMLNQKRPALVSCVTPINDNTVLGSRLGVTGTPTLIAADGRILPGAAPADKINEWLGGAK